MLARSAVTLDEIYLAAEWESRPALPGSPLGERASQHGMADEIRNQMSANLPLSMRAFAKDVRGH